MSLCTGNKQMSASAVNFANGKSTPCAAPRQGGRSLDPVLWCCRRKGAFGAGPAQLSWTHPAVVCTMHTKPTCRAGLLPTYMMPPPSAAARHVLQHIMPARLITWDKAWPAANVVHESVAASFFDSTGTALALLRCRCPPNHRLPGAGPRQNLDDRTLDPSQACIYTLNHLPPEPLRAWPAAPP